MLAEPITVVEIDIDYCARAFGVGACPAVLGGSVKAKCFNTFATCAAKGAFLRQTKTLRFCEARAGLPKGGPVMFPALVKVSAFSSTINVAAGDARLAPLGRRATVSVDLADFAYHDRELDLYQAERVTGAAVLGGVGYDPRARGSFFSRLRARWPYYAGRALRVVQGDLIGGQIVNTKTRNFVITEMAAQDDGATWTISGADILGLADNARALVPPASSAALVADLTATATTATLTPAGIGDAELGASGFVAIGGEIAAYTRSGDVLTLTRGQDGTTASTHSAGDTVQKVQTYTNRAVDYVLRSLLVNYAGVPEAFLPLSDWAAEVGRWAPSTLMTTKIASPTGVAKLLGEVCEATGATIWWDDVAQLVRLRMARPVDGETVHLLADNGLIVSSAIEDRDADRITDVLFFTVQKDPTKSADSADNYLRLFVASSADAKSANAFGDTKIRKVFSRWFNAGADPIVALQARRVLARLDKTPLRVRAVVDYAAADIALGDVVEVETAAITDASGAMVRRLMQVVGVSEIEPGIKLAMTLQDFEFSQRYGYATENSRPNYDNSTPAQRRVGMYACDPSTLKMPNGDEPYRAI